MVNSERFWAQPQFDKTPDWVKESEVLYLVHSDQFEDACSVAWPDTVTVLADPYLQSGGDGYFVLRSKLEML